jgi:hypothetical protein
VDCTIRPPTLQMTFHGLTDFIAMRAFDPKSATLAIRTGRWSFVA